MARSTWNWNLNWKFRILSRIKNTVTDFSMAFLVLFVLVLLGSNLTCLSAAAETEIETEAETEIETQENAQDLNSTFSFNSSVESKPRLFVWLHLESNRTQKIELSDADEPFHFSSSENASRLEIQCLASYPVEWRTSSQFAQQLSDHGIATYQIPLNGSKLLNHNQTNRFASIFDHDGKGLRPESGSFYSLEIQVDLEKDFVGDIGTCQERIEQNTNEKTTRVRMEEKQGLDQEHQNNAPAAQKLSILISGGNSSDRSLAITIANNSDTPNFQGWENKSKNKPAKIVVGGDSEVRCIKDNDTLVNEDVDSQENSQNLNHFSALICWSRVECDFLRGCSSDYCEQDSISGNSCEGDKNGSCLALPRNFSTRLPRLLQCAFNGSQNEIHAYSFIGLDKKQYFVNTDSDKIPRPPKSALIRIRIPGKMDEAGKDVQNSSNRNLVPVTLHTNGPHIFECFVSRFYFTEELIFLVVYQNKSTVAFPEDSIRLPSLYHIGIEMRVNLTTDMTKVTCRAPFYNSSEWIETTQNFIVKDPKITFDNDGAEQSIEFKVGDPTGTLYCKAKADPPPSFKWLDKNGMDLKNDSSFKVTDSGGGISLEFLKIHQNLGGAYICEATNEFRNSSQTFQVNVKDSDLGFGPIIGICVGAIIFFLAFGFTLYECVKTKRKLRNLTADEVDEFLKGNPDKVGKSEDAEGHENIQFLPFNKQFEVPHAEFSIDEKINLGSGEFGVVCGGKLRGVDVAIKTTKSTVNVEFFIAFLKEIKVMTFIGKHPNVVQLLGTSTIRIRERVVFVILELGIHGDLNSFLTEHQENFMSVISSSQVLNDQSEQASLAEAESETEAEMGSGYSSVPLETMAMAMQLIKWCGQIAAGMSHLGSKKIIHGDLAARNILLFDGYTAKISDFGFSRRLYSNIYSKTGATQLPWRIMAIESLKYFQFSLKSDVWAFGVLAWEIFSLAAVPYAGYEYSLEFIQKVEQGLRLPKPNWASEEIYDNMKECWAAEVENRPGFDQLEQFYAAILGAISGSATATETGGKVDSE